MATALLATPQCNEGHLLPTMACPRPIRLKGLPGSDQSAPHRLTGAGQPPAGSLGAVREHLHASRRRLRRACRPLLVAADQRPRRPAVRERAAHTCSACARRLAPGRTAGQRSESPVASNPHCLRCANKRRRHPSPMRYRGTSAWQRVGSLFIQPAAAAPRTSSIGTERTEAGDAWRTEKSPPTPAKEVPGKLWRLVAP